MDFDLSDAENGNILDTIHFETLYLSLKELIPVFHKSQTETEIKMNMTKLSTLCKKYESSKDILEVNAEDLYPEDYQNMCAYIQDFQELFVKSQKSWSNYMKKEYILISKDDYIFYEDSSQICKEMTNSRSDSIDTRVQILQNTALLLAKETRNSDMMDRSQYINESDTIGLSAVDIDESNYKIYLKAEDKKKREQSKECCHIF